MKAARRWAWTALLAAALGACATTPPAPPPPPPSPPSAVAFAAWNGRAAEHAREAARLARADASARAVALELVVLRR